MSKMNNTDLLTKSKPKPLRVHSHYITPRCNCLDPVLIINPSLSFNLIKSVSYYIDGVVHLISDDIRYDLISGESPSKLLHLPYVTFPERKESMSDKDYSKVIERTYDFLDGSVVVDEDGEYTPIWSVVPCGHCDVCNARKVASYAQRVNFAVLESRKPAYFLTLTYNQTHYNDVPSSDDMTRFFKRVRKLLTMRGYSSDFKYLYVSERGEKTNRIHYHLILMNLPVISQDFDSKGYYFYNYLFRYCWRESYRDTDGKWYSFDRYCQEYPEFIDIAPYYDPYSFGFINVQKLDSLQVCGYVLKYACKSAFEPSDNIKHCSINLGLSFVREHYKQLVESRDGSFQYMDCFTGEIKDGHLCGYYIDKLFPSYSKLLPVEWRRAYFDVVYAADNLANGINVNKTLKTSCILDKIALLEMYPFFPVPISPSRKRVLSYDVITEFIDMISRGLDYIHDNPVDFRDISARCLERENFLSKFKPQNMEDVIHRSTKYQHDIAHYNDISIF